MSSEGILVMDDAPSVAESLEQDLNILWALMGAYLVFFMQCGFSMLEAGTVRKQNTVNILLKVPRAISLKAEGRRWYWL